MVVEMEGTIDLTSSTHHWEKLNKKRVGLSAGKITEVIDMNPLDLVNHRRFDIVAKYIYGWFKKNEIESNWGRIIYDNHIWAFNQYDEDDGSGKKGINSFIDSFNETLNSFGQKGFDENVSLIPISLNNTPIDGAHRISTALLYNQMIKVARLNTEGPNYNYVFFRERGLLNRWCDAIAYEYCKLKKESIIIVLSSSELKEINKINKILDPFGSIFYEKDVNLNKNGMQNLIKQFKELSVQSFLNEANAENHLKILVFEPFDIKSAQNLKELMKENKSFSISESGETILYAQILLNENSIHFLNNTLFKKNGLLEESIREYRRKIDNHLNRENFTLVSDSVLAAYGESGNSNKLSFIFNERLNSIKLDEEIQQGIQNEFMATKGFSVDEIIYNPENHFYYNGVKFATLHLTKKIQAKGILKHNHLDRELIFYYTKKHTRILRLKAAFLKIKLMKLLKTGG
jgi:hypothetical protein